MASMGRILVIEDDPLVREIIAAILEEDYVVITASRASHGEMLLRDDLFDVVLLDCLLPGGGAARVMAEADRLGVPVVLVSGHAGQIGHCGGGARPFLAKPFGIDELLEMLGRAHAARQLSACSPEQPLEASSV